MIKATANATAVSPDARPVAMQATEQAGLKIEIFPPEQIVSGQLNAIKFRIANTGTETITDVCLKNVDAPPFRIRDRQVWDELAPGDEVWIEIKTIIYL